MYPSPYILIYPSIAIYPPYILIYVYRFIAWHAMILLYTPLLDIPIASHHIAWHAMAWHAMIYRPVTCSLLCVPLSWNRHLSLCASMATLPLLTWTDFYLYIYKYVYIYTPIHDTPIHTTWHTHSYNLTHPFIQPHTLWWALMGARGAEIHSNTKYMKYTQTRNTWNTLRHTHAHSHPRIGHWVPLCVCHQYK